MPRRVASAECRRRVRPPAPGGPRRCVGAPAPVPPRAPRSRRSPRDPAVLPLMPTYCARPMQGRQDLNLQPAVLETAALPIELHPLAGSGARRARVRGPAAHVPQESVRHRTAPLSGASSRGRPRRPTTTPPPPVGGGCRHGHRSTPLRHGTARPAPDLRTDRRHRRVGDAGGRRQGQGAQGGRTPRDRLRRRRARLPDARPDRRRRTGRVRGPEEPPLHPGRRAARTARGRRREDEARQRSRGHRRPGAHHQRRQAGRLPGLRDPGRPRRRGDPARAVLDHLPRGDHAGGRRARRGRRPGRTPTTCRRSSSSRPPAPRARRCCCGARRRTRPARSPPAS